MKHSVFERSGFPVRAKKTRQNDETLRRDQSRRISPELMAFYKQRAKQLRDQAYVDAARAVWALLKKIVGR